VGTSRGLFRHYWVVVKLVLTLVATLLLLLHTQPIGHLGAVAAGGARFGADLDGMRLQLVVDAAAALIVLLGATVLAVYKPRGLTPVGQRRAWGLSRPSRDPVEVLLRRRLSVLVRTWPSEEQWVRAEPTRPGHQPLPAPARGQPGRLAGVG
jgi:hypothetical protein